MKHSNGHVRFLPARRVGVHASAPFCRADIGFKRAIGITIFVLAAVVLATFAALVSGATANASVTHVTSAARTCAAFQRWNHHKTAANLNAMLAVSVNAPWVTIGTDAVVLYTDTRDGDKTDTRDDILYFGEDCRK